MLRSLAALLFLSLAGTAISQQHYIANPNKGKFHNITLDFDDLPTNSSGVGFHPTDPKQDALNYRSIYLQSFTLLNASSANLSSLDKQCSQSWPNSIFSSQQDGYPWPRISLHDLSQPKADLVEKVKKSDRTFSLVSVNMKSVGKLHGSPSDTLIIITFTMMRLDPDPRNEPIPPEAGYPGLVRGSPLPLFIGNATGVGIIFPPGLREAFTFEPKKIFGDDFGRDTDVIEVTSQVWRKEKHGPVFRPAEICTLCLDDIVLEIAKQDSSKHVIPNRMFHGVRPDGSRIKMKDAEWSVVEQMNSGIETSL